MDNAISLWYYLGNFKGGELYVTYQADADLKNAEGELLRRGIKILEAMPPEKRPPEYKAIRQQLIDIMLKI